MAKFSHSCPNIACKDFGLWKAGNQKRCRTCNSPTITRKNRSHVLLSALFRICLTVLVCFTVLSAVQGTLSDYFNEGKAWVLSRVDTVSITVDDWIDSVSVRTFNVTNSPGHLNTEALAYLSNAKQKGDTTRFRLNYGDVAYTLYLLKGEVIAGHIRYAANSCYDGGMMLLGAQVSCNGYGRLTIGQNSTYGTWSTSGSVSESIDLSNPLIVRDIIAVAVLSGRHASAQLLEASIVQYQDSCCSQWCTLEELMTLMHTKS